ncbi:addiction module RelE/StbE family toxin [Loktanella sp. PT4BL]|jgi:mRNA interferase RelE/StbE|uniref:type II toxin-antitoxin system RelE family toxin n=1 Tax=Loktanella sp. PT4BL TaxID=2135611 RepID=UPI000D7560EE|nr:type II toxin-antitoxin system RelE/ParE family toxin [Loktanella sp. PT4BL]PXW65603.1 addiction module RelE/StbE family toxin [Loktanella sp. PT4BL]
MNYELQFLPTALKEWRKLGVTLQSQFKNKLKERLAQPHVVADGLHGMPSHYKIKLRSAGYRLVYRVDDTTVTVTVVAVGKRERSAVYRNARKRADP